MSRDQLATAMRDKTLFRVFTHALARRDEKKWKTIAYSAMYGTSLRRIMTGGRLG